MLRLLLATALAEATRADSSVPYKNEATDLAQLWEEARSFLERSGSPPPEQLEKLMGAKTQQLLSSFLEASRDAGRAQSVRAGVYAHHRWAAPTAAELDPTLGDPGGKAAFEGRVAARMGKKAAEDDPLRELKARLKRDLAKTDATFQHDAHLDVPSYFRQLQQRGQAVLDAHASLAQKQEAVIAAHKALMADWSAQDKPGSLVEGARRQAVLPSGVQHLVNGIVTDTEARNTQVEEDMKQEDWSFPGADDIKGVITDEAISQGEKALVAGEPAFEAANAAEVADEEKEKKREAQDYKDLEVLVEHPPRAVHLQTHDSAEDAHRASSHHAKHHGKHFSHHAHHLPDHLRKD